MIFLIVCVIFVGLVCMVRRCCRHYRHNELQRSLDPYARRLRESSQEGYRDEPNINGNVNLSPRSSSLVNEEEAGRLATASSSRDPFASHLVMVPSQPPAHPEEGMHLLDLGPPKDEDGHVLHSVEIL